MASSIVNFIIKNFLSNFLEINPNQTSISLLSGEFIFKNVKIKQKLFDYINIDYMEIKSSYIGSIKFVLNLPNFYSNPIKIYITDFYIYSKQKKLDNINEKERIESLISNKIYKLTTDEDLLQQINQITDTSDNFVNQIIRNINIFIKNIVFRFEDEISNPKSPFSMGLIIKSFNFTSVNELYNDEFNLNDEKSKKSISKRSSKKSIRDSNNITIADNPYEISDKKIIINKSYFFIDTFKSKEENSFKKYISEKVKINISQNLENYINEILEFYYYCQSELIIHSNKKNSHEFIFYDLNLDIHFSMNFNVDNNKPQNQIIINDIKNFDIDLKIKQISLLFNLLSYYNLYYYYLIGLNKTIFNSTLTENEKEKYILDYTDYYYNKYILENNNFSLSKFNKEKEEKMTYEDISELRKIAINNIKLYEKLKEREKKLNELKNTWLFFNKNEEGIKKYEKEFNIINNLLKAKIFNQLNKSKNNVKNVIKENYNDLYLDDDLIIEKDPYEYLPDNFILFLFQIKIHSSHIIIYDDEYEKNNKKLIDINLKELFIKISRGVKIFNFNLELLDMFVNQEIIYSKEYDLIFTTEGINNKKINNQKKLLKLEFESNPLENYDYKIIIKNEKKIFLVLNLYELNYIQNKILTSIYTSISFMDLSQYAQKNINKYLNLGYLINLENIKKEAHNIETNKYINYYADIEIIAPMIIMPQNILDLNNNKCIIIHIGNISLKSNLVDITIRNYMLSGPIYDKQDFNDNLKRTKSSVSSDSYNSEDLYDNYNLIIKGINIFFSNECYKKDDYNPNDSSLILQNNEINILYQTLIISSNNFLNNVNLIISTNQIDINLDEFQILFLIDYLKYLNIHSDILYKKDLEKIKLDLKNKKIIEAFKVQLIDKGILTEDENENQLKDGGDDNNFKSYENENDFLTKKNEYFYEVKINKINFKIFKIFPDLEKTLFLESYFDCFEYIMCGNSINDSLMKISIKLLKLFDKEKDINKNYLSISEYQTLIERKNILENSDMFSYSNIYKNKLKESQTELKIFNTNLILSFDTLTRLYLFSMYYYNIFYANYLDANYSHKQNLNKQNKLKNNSEEESSQSSDDIIINSDESDIMSNHSENNSQNIKELVKNKYSFRIKLVENYLIIPYDKSSLTCPIISAKVNMIYDQTYEKEISKIFNNKRKKLIKTIERPNIGNMNIMIYESDIDFIEYNKIKQIFILKRKSKKILSNYRIQYTCKSIYLPENNQYLSKTDISIEPIIIKINLDDLKNMILFYNQSMKFLYEKLYEIYIPYIKPEDVRFHKGKMYIKKKKLTLKKLLTHIIKVSKIKKSFDKRLKEIKKKKIFSKINSSSIMNIYMNRITVTIFDNDIYNKRLLLELQVSKLNFKSINNSQPKNKINVMNELMSIISGVKIPINDYIIHQLYNYMDITCIFKFYYYNLDNTSFEPIIDPIFIQYLSYQVDPIFRHKTLIKSDNIINFNISPACIKVLNLFLAQYYSDESNDNKININKSITASKEIVKKNSNNIKINEKIILKVINKTGITVKFWFDFKNQEKYILNDKDFMNFSNSSLYGTRIQHTKILKNPEKNTFSFQLLGYETISKININKNNILYFKTNIKDNKYLLYSVIIDTSENINKIKIVPSLVFINKTKFDQMIISIDDERIKDNYFVLKKDKKIRIPLTWMISNQKILIQLCKDEEKNILYNNIFECVFCQKLNEEELEKRNKDILDSREKLTNDLNSYQDINLQHPKYKEYISTFINNKFNKKNIPDYLKKTTLIDKKRENKSISFSFNYLALSNNEKCKEMNNKIFKNLKNTKKSYKYYIIIRPIITIYNSIPFDIQIDAIINKDNNKKEIKRIKFNIKSLKKHEIYDANWSIDNKVLITMNLSHYNNIYSTNRFPIIEKNNEDILKNVKLKDKKSNCIISNILIKNTEEEENLNNFIEQYSLSSIDYIFFSEYIVNNRMEFEVYSKNNIEEKGINIFKNKKLSLLSNYKEINNLYLNSEKVNFVEENKVNLKSIGYSKNIELIKHNYIFNVSCTILNSVNYKYSNIILFEPKYILVNNLDFDIFYTQVTDSSKKVVKKLCKNEKITLSYNINEDKKIFKLAIDYKTNCFSGPFDITESKDYDFKIEINKELFKKYKSHSFKLGKKYYLYFRIKYNIYQYTTYIIIFFPLFPLFQIKNRTFKEIKIFESEVALPSIVEPLEEIPFIWKDSTNTKERLTCQILESKFYFSFVSFTDKKIKLGNKKYLHIRVKRDKTGSLILIVEIKNFIHEISDYFINKCSKSLSEISLNLKGIGLSFMDETPKEIFYISFYKINILKRNTLFLKSMENIEDISFNLQNFQIDYCLNDSLKSLIYPKIQKIPSLEEQIAKGSPDFISIFVERTSYNDSENKVQYMNYDKIFLSVQELNLKINQIILTRLINLIMEYTSYLDYNEIIMKKSKEYKLEDNLIIDNDKFIENMLKENKDSNKTLINYLILSEMKLNISVRIDLSNVEISFLPDFLTNIIMSLGSNFIKISNSPLSFNPKILRDIYMDTNLIISKLIENYRMEAIFQILKILGSTDLIGNPVNLIENIGNGFFEFVNEPTKALMQDPSNFGKGLVKGVGGLLNGVVGGTMDSVSKITGTLYTTFHGILGKKKGIHIEENEDDEPENLIAGAEKGIESGYQEIKEGLKGLFINPFQNDKNSGILDYIKDLGVGLFGLAISPITFILKLGGSLAVGTKNTFGFLFNKIIKNERFRFPRYIEDSKPLQIYDEDLSAAKEFLIKLVNIENPLILYFASFICNNPGYSNKLAFLIVTKEQFLLLSNKSEIFWNLNIKEIQEIKLIYKNDNFKILFRLKNKKNKVLIIDKSNAIVTCYLYDLLKEEMDKLSLVN